MLAPRQIGKTSLALKTREKLRRSGIRYAAVDLNEIGGHVTAETWFYSLVTCVAGELGLEEHVESFWEAHAKESLPSRWTHFCRNTVLQEVAGPVVIFIDEIDTILSVPTVADDFFASLRAMHEKREEDPVFKRLSFCLLGVAAPRELMKDEARTPFNIGLSIPLEDFTPAEAERLLPGLAGLGHAPRALLEAILAWTDGHPYMTLRIAHALVREGEVPPQTLPPQARVEGWVQRLFLENGRQEEPNLRYAEDRFSRGQQNERIPRMLSLYRRLLAGEAIAAVGSDPIQQEFRLTGMVTERRDASGRWLRVRNRIFATVFDEAWVRTREADRLLTQPLEQWLEQDRTQDLLLRGEVLEQARKWARHREDLTQEEREFLDASQDSAAKDRTRRAILTVLASALVVLMGMVGVLAKKNQEVQQSSTLLMQETARLAAALGRHQGDGADALGAALSTLVMAEQLQAPAPPEAFSGIMLGVSDLKYSSPLKGHENGVQSAAFSPDGSLIVTASDDQTALLWDSHSGQPLATLKHERSVLSAAFSPDGTRIVTASDDQTARIWGWDGHSAQLLATLQGHENSVQSAAFSPDGSLIITASSDGSARRWDGHSGQFLAPPLRHEGDVWSAAFSPDGARIVTASEDQTARIWDGRSGQPLATLQGHLDDVRRATFSPDGARIVTASDDQTARIWDSRSGQLLSTLAGHQGPVWSAAFSPDGARIVTASEDQTARLWDGRSGQRLTLLQGHRDSVLSAAFSPDGTRIVTASDDQTARIWGWDGHSVQLLATLQGHRKMVRSAAFSPDGLRIVTASKDGTARIWDGRSGPFLATLEHEAPVWSAAFSPDGSLIVTASKDHTARIWDGRSGQLLALPALQHERPIQSVTFSPEGSRIVTASEDHTARLWDGRSGQLLATLKHEGSVWSAAFSQDGARIVTASSDGMARIWDGRSGQPLATLQGHQGTVRSAAFSPDGARLITASSDGTARIWNGHSGQLLAPPLRHEGDVWSAAFSPDGTRIVTASDDQTARLWDGLSGQPLSPPLKHGDVVWSAAFSPDGTRIVTASSDGTARIWDGRSGQALSTLQEHTGPVWSAAFSPDGTRIVTTGQDDPTACIWDSHSGQLLAKLQGPPDDVRNAVFSPDGSRVVTTSSPEDGSRVVTPGHPGTARLWIASLEGWLIEACNLPQFTPPTEELRAFCNRYKGRTP
ncbi:WD-40 repeat [Stigmatella aurantiaca DW4/3-1]|uniref:WD-40 repeat n=1 Tax=Stigmatella aurantiaca (strain DW4/3-1) TaxID=378806 RepID=Q08PY4_STIAD|nr:WD-40 repeat [Stigmatella aurantiaca DW4/3-1]